MNRANNIPITGLRKPIKNSERALASKVFANLFDRDKTLAIAPSIPLTQTKPMYSSLIEYHFKKNEAGL